MRAFRRWQIRRFLILFLVVSVLAAALALAVSALLEKFTGYSPAYYEPKDAERKQLIEERGKSVQD